jgi:hypothetical protein
MSIKIQLRESTKEVFQIRRFANWRFENNITPNLAVVVGEEPPSNEVTEPIYVQVKTILLTNYFIRKSYAMHLPASSEHPDGSIENAVDGLRVYGKLPFGLKSSEGITAISANEIPGTRVNIHVDSIRCFKINGAEWSPTCIVITQNGNVFEGYLFQSHLSLIIAYEINGEWKREILPSSSVGWLTIDNKDPSNENENTTSGSTFISYKRAQNPEIARLIHSELRQKGRTAFLDVDDMSSGRFDEQIKKRIEQSDNFIVILTKGCLDNVNNDDWIALEISHAIKCQRNIIPITTPDFQWPDQKLLPEGIKELHKYHSLKYSHEFFKFIREELFELLQP